MPNPTADLIISQRHARTFLQQGASRPNNKVTYYGLDASWVTIGDANMPDAGGVAPVFVHDPRRQGKYKLVSRTISPPDLDSSSLQFHEKHGAIPAHLIRGQCPISAYVVVGNCQDLSNILLGWNDYVMVYSEGLTESKTASARTAFNTDNAYEDTVSVKWSSIYIVGSMSFGEGAAIQIDREVIDIVYGDTAQCGNCGPQNDGTGRIYAVVKSSGAGSPGLPAEVVYSVDGGVTWTDANITSFGATEDPLAIDIVGDKLVVIGSAAYFWATMNILTGVPGTWSKVTSGFVANKAPNDMYVANSREIYFAGNGGYIYKSTDITSGVTPINAGSATTQNLYRIHGLEECIVTTGAQSTVVKSVNRGSTWATTTLSPSLVPLDVRAVCVLDKLRYWVGVNNAGRMYYTLNGGETWTEQSFSGSGSGNVWDIVAATNEVIFMSHSDNTPTGYLHTTYDGGADWVRNDAGSQRLLNWPTLSRANRLAVPSNADATITANSLAVAGLSGGGTDGILLFGVASKV